MCNSAQRARSGPARLEMDIVNRGGVMSSRVGERLVDSFGFLLVVWSIPVAILVVGAPIVMAVALVMSLARWMAQS